MNSKEKVRIKRNYRSIVKLQEREKIKYISRPIRNKCRINEIQSTHNKWFKALRKSFRKYLNEAKLPKNAKYLTSTREGKESNPTSCRRILWFRTKRTNANILLFRENRCILVIYCPFSNTKTAKDKFNQ